HRRQSAGICRQRGCRPGGARLGPAAEQFREVLADYLDEPVYGKLEVHPRLYGFSTLTVNSPACRGSVAATSGQTSGDRRSSSPPAPYRAFGGISARHAAPRPPSPRGVGELGFSCRASRRNTFRSSPAAIGTPVDGDTAQPERVLARDRVRLPRGLSTARKIRARTLAADGPRRRSTCIGDDRTLGNPGTISLRRGWAHRPPEISS